MSGVREHASAELSSWALSTVMNQLHKRKSYREALVKYSEAIDLWPQCTSCYGNRSACYLTLGQPRPAISKLREPEGDRTRQNRGMWTWWRDSEQTDSRLTSQETGQGVGGIDPLLVIEGVPSRVLGVPEEIFRGLRDGQRSAPV